MKAKKRMCDLLKDAEANGYAAVANAGAMSLKTFACSICKKVRAIKLVAHDEGHAVIACSCGYRKRTVV